LETDRRRKVAEKQLMKKQEQQLLSFKTVTGLHEFTQANILQYVTEIVATNNQVSN
jgi:hypothetical protein